MFSKRFAAALSLRSIAAAQSWATVSVPPRGCCAATGLYAMMSPAVKWTGRSSRSAPSSTRRSTAITSGSLKVLASGNRCPPACVMRCPSRKSIAATPSRPPPRRC